MAEPLVYYVGDLNPSISEQITVNGTGLDLSGKTVAFKMRAVGSSTLKVSTSATIVTTSSGHVRYDWTGTDTNTAGRYLVWWEVTTSGRVQAMQEALIDIRAHAAGSPLVYGDVTQLKNTLSLTGTQFADVDLQTALESASRAIDQMCERRFYTTTSDEVRYFSPRSYSYIDAGDVLSVTTLRSDEDGDGVFEQTWTSNTDYVLEPLNSSLDARPYTLVTRHPTSSYYFPADYPRSVQVTGKFGWNAVPPEISQATTILAAQLVQRARMAPFGVVAVGIDQTSAIRLARVDPQVAALIGPYIRAPFV